MTSLSPPALVWFRRDFRIQDQTALEHACREHPEVLPIFVIDPRTLEDFSPGKKPHAAFFGALLSLRATLKAQGRDLLLLEGDPTQVLPELARKLKIQALYYNKDYEPYARERDLAVTRVLQKDGVPNTNSLGSKYGVRIRSYLASAIKHFVISHAQILLFVYQFNNQGLYRQLRA